MKLLQTAIIILAATGLTMAQKPNLEVPKSILAELHTITIPLPQTTDSISLRVAYPAAYSPSETYPVLLGLSGGNQSLEIVNYCYAAWFRTGQFKRYLTVVPVAPEGRNLRDYGMAEIQALMDAIKAHFNTTPNGWTVAGTSNGGVATFNFLAADPGLFDGAVVIPGTMAETVEITNSWRHLSILLACGTEDAKDWIDATKATETALKGKVRHVQSIMLKGQGHISPIDFDLDVVYSVYKLTLK